ncbi:reverse transcriptase domain-containing protein [Tanacetum coccineum]
MVGHGKQTCNSNRIDVDRGNDSGQRDPRDVEIERLQQRIRDLEIQQESPNEETESEPHGWDVGGDEDHNPFGNFGQNFPGPNREDPLCNMGMKIEIPEFKGKLRKYASFWWDHVKKQRLQDGKSKVETWPKMKKLLQEKFLPVNHRQEAFLEYHILTHRNTSVEDFIAELALKVEKQLKNKGQSTASRVTPSSRFTSITPVKTPTLKPDTPSASASQSVIRCFKCQGLCHLKRDCPNKQLVSLVEDTPTPVYDTYDDEEANDDDEVIYPDSGEALITQRVLNVVVTKAIDDASWLRNNIFRTKCTTKGKVCSVIIDGGSCENMVATSMVEKLGLDTQDHPEPYQLTWLKKGNVIKVSKRCLVHFSIGKKYNDEVWCEVIPMDACHILLGRPWQYDRRTKHDGFRNTYSFKKDGINIMLALLDIRQNPSDALVLTKS